MLQPSGERHTSYSVLFNAAHAAQVVHDLASSMQMCGWCDDEVVYTLMSMHERDDVFARECDVKVNDAEDARAEFEHDLMSAPGNDNAQLLLDTESLFRHESKAGGNLFLIHSPLRA